MKLTRPLLFASALALAMGVQAQGMGNSAAGSGTGSSPSSSSSSTAGSTSETMSDKSFATQAAEVGQAEIRMGKLAQKKASDPAVKDYAKQLVNDHTSNSKQLDKVAKSEKIKLPKKLSGEDKATYDELSKLSGRDFDQRFVQAQVQAHTKAIDLYQQEANKTPQGPLENYARNTLPHLQMHLDAANRLATQVGSSSGQAGSSAAGGASGSSETGTGPSKSGKTGY